MSESEVRGEGSAAAEPVIESPIRAGFPADFVDEIPVKGIVERYLLDYGLDVSDYFRALSAVRIYRCRRTGYRFYHPHYLAGGEDLYAALQRRVGYYRLKWEHRIALRHLRTGEHVLEVGCGAGLFLEELARNRIEGLGLELSRLAVDEARSHGLPVRNTLLAEYARERVSHGAVCAFQVLEHVPWVGEFIESALAVLRPGGKLIVGVPNSNPYLYRYEWDHTLNLPPHHMGLWDARALRALTSVFPLRLKALHVEPLRGEEYGHYWELASKRAPSAASRLLAAAMSVAPRVVLLRPLSSAARTAIGRLLDGRNLVAVFEKH